MPTIENASHPYPIGENETQEATVPGAHHVFVTFDQDVTDVYTTDIVNVYDENDAAIFNGGLYGYELVGLRKRFSVLGPTVKLNLTGPYTDGSYWGYRATVDEVSDVPGGPYLIDSVSGYFLKWFIDATGWPGPYYNGTERFMVFEGYPGFISIYKSTDGGVTWTEAYNLSDSQYGWAQKGSGPTKIRILYNSLAVNHKWVIGEFDMEDGTWTEITNRTDSTVDASGYVYNEIRGIDHVFYRPTVYSLYLMNYDGSWGSGVHVSTNISSPVQATIGTADVDETGDLHICFIGVTGSPSYTRANYYRKFKSDDTLTNVVTLITGMPTQSKIVGNMAFTGNYVVIPYETDDPVRTSTWTIPAVFSGSDYHDDVPVFNSYEVVGTDNNIGEVHAVTGPDGLVYVWWLQLDSPDHPYQFDQLRYRTFDGVNFGEIVVAHDEMAYPSPTNDVSSQFMHDFAAPVWNPDSSTWEMHMGLEYNPLGTNDQYCTGFFLGVGSTVSVGGGQYALVGPAAGVDLKSNTYGGIG